MNKIQRINTSFMLNEIAQLLDISDSLFEEAERKYRAVGTWLGEDGSPLSIYSPQIYPQGSFLLGTVTRPLGDEDDFDLDLVFELIILKNTISQKRLKHLVGDRLKANEVYKHMLGEEGRRCWTLEYANSSRFHLDILPAVPDNEFAVLLEKQGVQQKLATTSISLTDNTSPNYERIDFDWPSSNPKGYAAWFRERMIIQYTELRKNLAEALKADVDRVQSYRIKTPLQRCIQLLKRHRDIAFEHDKDNKPASIILTTLAANAYNNESDLGEALINIVNGMPSFITTSNGVACVTNPVNPSENFADRWKDHPNREPNFRRWLKTLQSDVNRIMVCDDVDKICEMLSSIFGEKVSVGAVTKFKETAQKRNGGGSEIQFPRPASVSITQPNKPWGKQDDRSTYYSESI